MRIYFFKPQNKKSNPKPQKNFEPASQSNFNGFSNPKPQIWNPKPPNPNLVPESQIRYSVGVTWFECGNYTYTVIYVVIWLPLLLLTMEVSHPLVDPTKLPVFATVSDGTNGRQVACLPKTQPTKNVKPQTPISNPKPQCQTPNPKNSNPKSQPAKNVKPQTPNPKPQTPKKIWASHPFRVEYVQGS